MNIDKDPVQILPDVLRGAIVPRSSPLYFLFGLSVSKAYASHIKLRALAYAKAHGFPLALVLVTVRGKHLAESQREYNQLLSPRFMMRL